MASSCIVPEAKRICPSGEEVLEIHGTYLQASPPALREVSLDFAGFATATLVWYTVVVFSM